MDVMVSRWTNGTAADAAQVYSVPVFMLMQAVGGMTEAKNLAIQEQLAEEAEKEAKEKNFILLIVEIVLMFVASVGEEAAAAAGFESIARTIALLGKLRNAGFAVYDTVQDPSSAIVNVLGLLMGVESFAEAPRDGAGLSAIAKIRKAMKVEDILALGAVFRCKDDQLQSIFKICELR